MFSQVLVPCSWIFGVSLNVPAFLSYVYVKEVGGCVYLLTEEWMGKLLSMSWFIFLGFLPVVVMTALYSRVVYALWFKSSDNAGNNSQQVGKTYPTNTAVSLCSSPLGTFRQEERVRLSDRNSILMT